MASAYRRRLLWVIVIGAGLAFSRALFSDYVSWDDDQLILKNVYLTAPFAEAMKGSWTHSFEGDYLPIPFLSYWLEVRAWGFDPLPQHVVNWLLHLTNICLVYVWLSRIRIAPGVALFVTMVFALHPLQTESVLWLAERKGLLSSCFLLLGLIAFSKATVSERVSWPWAVIWTTCFLLSCLCKVTGIFLPFVLVMNSRFVEGRPWQASFRPHLGTALLALGFCVLRYAAYTMTVPGIGAETLTLSHWLTLPVLVPTAIGHYISSLFYPFNLSIMYPSFADTPHRGLKLALGAGYVALLIRVARGRQRGPQVLLGVWFLALLLPVLNVVPRINFVNDRYMYLPIIGLTGFLASLVSTQSTFVRRIVWNAAGVGLGVCLAGLSFKQSAIWQNSLVLWEDTVQRAPSAQVAWNNLGLAQLERGNVRDAEQSLLVATKFLPRQTALPFVNLGQLYLTPGQPMFNPPKAYQLLASGLESAVALDEQFALRFNMAVAQLRMNHRSEAVDILRALLTDMEKASANGSHRNLEAQVRDALSAIGR